MGTLVKKNAVKREKGYLYYIDGKGNIMKSKMGNKKKKRRK